MSIAILLSSSHHSTLKLMVSRRAGSFTKRKADTMPLRSLTSLCITANGGPAFGAVKHAPCRGGAGYPRN